MTATTEQAMAPAIGWLRSPSFDLAFLVGTPILAIASGVAVVNAPQLFLPILIANLWLFGYQHVIATYTRLCFDRESFRDHRFLVLGLPFLVLAGVVAASSVAGFWVLASVYFYWQWFHYSRQSFGVSQAYRRKAAGAADENEHLAKATFYLLPLWGILHRSHQDPGEFLGLDLWVLPVPGLVVDVVGVVALASLVWWGTTRIMAWWQGRLAVAHTLYLISHFAIFGIGYVAIDSIDAGWLVLNIWHNIQYILFVWLFNNSRFRDGVSAKARFLSRLSQSRNFWAYGLVCFGLSTFVYMTLISFVVSLVPAIVIYQTINFHHYLVDGVIWKMRKKPMRKTLGLAH
ncbi:MAG: hypothetical protein ACTSX7_12845 [Alphaproteobacteria bacterium]